MKYSGFVCVAMIPVCSGAMGQTSAFAPGNLVVVQVGDGTPGMSTAAAPVFLKEIRIVDGAVIRTVALPTVSAGSQRRLTLSGTIMPEGMLQRSADGRYLSLAGYDAEVGTAAVAGTNATLVNRVIARISSNAEIDTSTAFAAFSGANIRSAVSLDGSQFWVSGSSIPSGLGGVHHILHGAGTSVQIASQVNYCRVVDIAFGGLYVTTSGGGFTGLSVVGTGLPSTAGQPLSLLSGMPGASTSSYMDFAFADANTLYVADERPIPEGGGVQKWTFDGTIWRPMYVLNQGITTGAYGLTAVMQGGVPVVYATTDESLVTGTRLWKVIDTGGGSVFSVVASAPSHTSWRGVEWAPVAGAPSVCYANCDGSTAAPVLNVADFTCFLQRFAGGHSEANCDGSTLPPVLNVADFSCFLQRFAAGCP